MATANDTELSPGQLQNQLTSMATDALPLWQLPKSARARLINISENATFLVEADDGYRSILRIHRPGYHTRNAISCELAWMADLGEHGGVVTPATLVGVNGETIQQMRTDVLPGSRYLVMFEFVEGIEPDENENLVARFEELGEIAARTHRHSISWKRPDNFERLVWNIHSVFGDGATWGNWRDAPAMSDASQAVMQRLEDTVTERLQRFGDGPDRYGLIHADMRLANLLIHHGSTRLIDFDDCGLGWFLYDFAAGISFMEDHPQVPALKRAWVAGYRKIRPLSAEDEQEMDTFVMLRRMALCAWIGSHNDVDIARKLSPVFVPVTVELAKNYLESYGR